MTTALFVIVAILMTPTGPQPHTPPFLFETKSKCEVTKEIGDKQLRQDPEIKFVASFCVAIGGSV
jgi:hypothetical protein